MVLDQRSQLPLLLELRSSPGLLIFTTPPLLLIWLSIPHQARNIITLLLILASLVPHMVYTNHSSQDRRSTQVINSKVRTALVFVLQERKASTLSCFFVADEVHVHWFSELRTDGYHVSFGEVVGEAADVDVSCVAVVCVP